jgi:ADP-ribosylglycohydrolase/protein-tyrosine phosphatase
MQPSEHEAERLEGAVWGHLVGDALGVPYEFRPPDRVGEVVFGARGTHRQPPGTWSDDGALMLALLDSLVGDDAAGAPGERRSVRFDLVDQGRRILAWHESSAYTPDGDAPFDVGGATLAAIGALRRGVPPQASGSTLPDALGNGSLMRILPLGLAGRDADDATLVGWASAASAVTHGAPLARAACALATLATRRLLADPDRPAAVLDDAVRALRRVAAGGPLAAAVEELLAWQGRSGRGHVADAFWSAWEAFAGASTYEEAVRRAIRLGNDTDTTAAIAGGLAGIRWGIDGIPVAWRSAMRGHDVAGPLVDRLLATAGWRTSTSSPLRVDWVPREALGRLAGRAAGEACTDAHAPPAALGMTVLPGKRRVGYSGPQWRDPFADARRLRDDHGCTTLLLLVEDADIDASHAWTTLPALAAVGIEVLRHPVRDMDVPVDAGAYRTTLDTVAARLAAGGRVVVACRGGLGRTGTAVACLLVDGGADPDAAIAAVRAARRGTVERPAQEAFVRSWGQGAVT